MNPLCPLCGSPTKWAHGVRFGPEVGGGLALAEIVRRRQCGNCGAYLRTPNDDEETDHDDN